jgi:hypothetical protein
VTSHFAWVATPRAFSNRIAWPVVLTLAFASVALLDRPVFADQPGPMQTLARDLGTPKIGYTARDDKHARTMLEFVRPTETVKNWTKLFTVVATHVDVDRTQAVALAQIQRLRDDLLNSRAKISTYEVRADPPRMAYFKYVLDGETNVGVIFSPIPGVVTMQQVAARRTGVVTAEDIRRMKRLVGYPR